MSCPKVLDGGDQDNFILVEKIGMATKPAGAKVFPGFPEADNEGTLKPSVVTARTRKVYSVPASSPEYEK